MKTVRFSKIVEKCGAPETYLVLMDPSKDRKLQAAVKAQRVLTVSQEAVGTKTDRGGVGFRPGANRQFFLFPKSLRAFAGRTVVGIKYELLTSPSVPKSKRAAPPKPPKQPKSKPAEKLRSEKAEPPVARKVVAHFDASEPGRDERLLLQMSRSSQLVLDSCR